MLYSQALQAIAARWRFNEMKETYTGDRWDVYTRDGQKLGQIGYRGGRIYVVHETHDLLHEILRSYGDDHQGAVRAFARIVSGKHMSLIGVPPGARFEPIMLNDHEEDGQREGQADDEGK